MPMSTQSWMQRWGHKFLVSTHYNAVQDEADIGGNLGASELIISQKPDVYDLWASATYCLPTTEIWTLSSFQFRNEYFFEKSRLPGTRCEAVGMRPPGFVGVLRNQGITRRCTSRMSLPWNVLRIIQGRDK